MPVAEAHPSSYRDPSGFVFVRNGVVYRQVNQAGQADYEAFRASGLSDELVHQGALLPYGESDEAPARPEQSYKILKPERVQFISYPYEWSFSMLKDAALLTLAIERQALGRGFSLKDASAYNIQFQGGRPVLIDHLSFERYNNGQPWVGYRQFCEQFLAPLALMSLSDIRLGQLLRTYLDGVPLDLASRLLPVRTRLSLGLGAHIHLHARNQRTYARQPEAGRVRALSKNRLLALVSHLESTVRSLSWRPAGTTWADYYSETNYTDESFTHKKELVRRMLQKTDAKTALDLGANTGVFSEIAGQAGLEVRAVDNDPAAIERLYLRVRSNSSRVLPLVIDLMNPSSGSGWMNEERAPFLDRGKSDVVLALALVHHLAIGQNLPFRMMAECFARLGRWLIVEFVPKNDSQAQRLLRARTDIFPDYDEVHFQQAFEPAWSLIEAADVPGSDRKLFLYCTR